MSDQPDIEKPTKETEPSSTDDLSNQSQPGVGNGDPSPGLPSPTSPGDPPISQEDEKYEGYFGWGKMRCCQVLNRPSFFLFCLCVGVAGQSMSINGFVSVSISTLETRFGFTSTQAGWMISAYEIAGIPALMLIGYLGATVHRPRWIAGGLVCLTLGTLIFSLPHFITGTYEYRDSVVSPLCLPGANTTDLCGVGDSGEVGLHRYLGVFIFGTMLIAVGAVPLYVLGIPYMDDALTKGTASIYLGIFYTMSVIGPAVAYIGGGFLLNVIFTDADVIDTSTLPLTSDDPRWVGAWWIGFLICCSLVFIMIFPMSMFPFKLPCDADVAASKTAEMQAGKDSEAALQPGFGSSIRDFPKSLRILFTNWPFLFTCLYGSCDAILINGFSAFGPKYLENQFGLSAGMAAIIFGVVAVPGGAGGFLVGSFLMKKLDLSCAQLLKWMFGGALVAMATGFLLAIQCENPRLAGVTDKYFGEDSLSTPGVYANCSGGCGCSQGLFEPICGADSMTYFSPCYAGCLTEETSADGVTTYSDCSCIPGVNNTAVSGFCAYENCSLLPLFVILFFINMFVIFVCGIFHISALLRCVPTSQRSMAIAVDWLLARALGSMPGPLLFGAVFDGVCLLWETKCDEGGSCLNSDNSKLGWYLLLVLQACKVLQVLFGLLAWKLYKPVQEDTASGGSQDKIKEYFHEKEGFGDKNGAIEGKDNPAYEASIDTPTTQL